MRKLLFLSIVALAMISCKQEGFKIKGEIEGATDQMVNLQFVKDNELVTADSTMMSGGKFTFKGSVDVPDLVAVDFTTSGERIIMFLENSEIQIKGTVDNVMASTITGSKSQDILLDFNNQQEEKTQKLMEINFRYQAAAQDGILTPALEEELYAEYVLENNKYLSFIKEFVKSNNQSVVAAYITLRHLSNSIETLALDSIVSNFPKEIQGSPFVKHLSDQLEVDKRTAIGQPFIDFTQLDPSGNNVSLSSYVGEKYVLIDFWAAWCAPCRKENPNLVKLYSQYGPKGFEIFGVSFDRERGAWLDAIEKDGLTWPQVSDLGGWENPVAKLYGIMSIPSNLLLDREGKIIAKNLRGEDLEKKLAEIFN
jgi:peroxiredoxin